MADIKVVSEEYYNEYNIIDALWSGGKDRAEDLTEDQISTILGILSDEYPEGIDAGTLNDFFWFEDNTYAEWLGYRSAEDLWSGKDEDYYECDSTIRIDRADIPDIGVDESVDDYLYNHYEYGEDYEDVDDENETYDEENDTYSGSVEVWVSQSGKDHLTENGIKFTET